MSLITELRFGIDPTHLSTRLVFWLGGAMCALWAALVPFLKVRLAINEAELGLLLLCLGAGSMCVMPFTGVIVSRFGCRRVVAVAWGMSLVLVPLIAMATSVWMAAIGIALLGGMQGAGDVAMNIQSVVVEKRSRRAMLSGFHAMFSVGGLLGALIVTLLLNMNFGEMTTVIVMLLIFAIILSIAVPRCIVMPDDEPEGRSRTEKRRFSNYVLFIGFLCFVMFLTEGSVLDWSAVYLREEAGMSPENAVLGFAFFSATMTLGRLTGDRLIERLGRRKTVFFGGLLCAASFALLGFGLTGPSTLIVFALIGVGASNLVPVFFWLAGNQNSMPVAQAMALAATCGYIGILAGPAVIGFVAHVVSLPFAFGLIALLVFVVAISSLKIQVE